MQKPGGGNDERRISGWRYKQTMGDNGDVRMAWHDGNMA